MMINKWQEIVDEDVRRWKREGRGIKYLPDVPYPRSMKK